MTDEKQKILGNEIWKFLSESVEQKYHSDITDEFFTKLNYSLSDITDTLLALERKGIIEGIPVGLPQNSLKMSSTKYRVMKIYISA